MLPRATKNSALRPSRSNSGWANASAHSPPRCSAASRKPIEPLTLAQDNRLATAYAEPEEARGGAHVLIRGVERPDRADAQRGRGAVEERDVDPARLERRPPAQPGGLRVRVEQPRGVALRGRAPARRDLGRAQRLGGQHERVVEVDERRAVVQLDHGQRQRPAHAREQVRVQFTGPAERRERLGDRGHRRLAHVQAAVAGAVVVPPGALERAREPERPARRRGAGRRVPGQDPPQVHAKLPARSVAIASSSSRACPRRIRSSGRRSPRLGFSPTSQRSATASG